MSNQETKRPRIIKKIKKGGHHGGAWKVAYADFVTAMMALFLVLWLVSQADVKVKQAIASYFRSPGVFDTMKGGVVSGPTKVSKEPSAMSSKDEEQILFNVSQTLQKAFQQKPQFTKYKEQIKIEITEEGLKIQYIDKADRVAFPSGSAELSGEAKDILTEIAKGICELPNPILIGGHTDKKTFPEGSTYTNWELSADRANAARRTLEAACVKPEQIRKIVGYADTELLIPDDPYNPANRRISITVLRLYPTEKVENQDGNSGTGSGLEEEQIKEQTKEQADEVLKQKEKLKTEGATSVGEPDRIPDKVQKTREQPKKKTEQE